MDKLFAEFAEFVEFLRESKNKPLSQSTIESYLRDVDKYFKFVSQNGGSVIDDGETLVKEFALTLKAKNKADSTISRMLASVRNYYSYLVSIGELERNPVRKVSVERSGKKSPEILTKSEIDRFMSQLSDDDIISARDKVMIELLCATGMQVSEIISVNVSDVANKGKFIAYNSGSRKDRVFALDAKLSRRMCKYLSDIRPRLAEYMDEQALFVNAKGKRLTRQGFWKIVRTYAETAGITKRVTPKMIRHTYAVQQIINGASSEELRQLLGHVAVSTTFVYEELVKLYLGEEE
ncbi:MAG: tyrosine-type recombinase/integrase [Clostridia bacterium]|nr:tyrosine-type recombinase/integrase [Clostridia bacterium]